MKDISSRREIEQLVDAFYTMVLKDDIIGPIFTNTIQFEWESHIPKMYDFWDSVLFHTAIYKGNPMLKHIDLNRKETLSVVHFDRWIDIWKRTIDQNFEGEIAERAKEKAIQIGAIMQQKIKKSEYPNLLE